MAKILIFLLIVANLVIVGLHLQNTALQLQVKEEKNKVEYIKQQCRILIDACVPQ